MPSRPGITGDAARTGLSGQRRRGPHRAAAGPDGGGQGRTRPKGPGARLLPIRVWRRADNRDPRRRPCRPGSGRGRPGDAGPGRGSERLPRHGLRRAARLRPRRRRDPLLRVGQGCRCHRDRGLPGPAGPGREHRSAAGPVGLGPALRDAQGPLRRDLGARCGGRAACGPTLRGRGVGVRQAPPQCHSPRSMPPSTA